MNLHHWPDTLFKFSHQNEDVHEVSEEKFDGETEKESENIVLLDVSQKTLDSSRTEVEDHDGFWQVSECDGSDSLDSNTADSKIMEVKDYEALNGHSYEDPGHIKEKMDHLSDKIASELEVPDLVICYRENSYLDIKDICIDENMPSCEKILFETDVEKEDLHTLLLLEKDRSSNLMTKTTEVGAPMPDYSKSCEDQDHKNSFNQDGSEDILQAYVKVQEVAEDVLIGQTLSKDQMSASELNQQELSAGDLCHKNTQMPTEEPSMESILSVPARTPADEGRASFSNAEESHNSIIPNHEEAISTSSDESNNASPVSGSSNCSDRKDYGNQENQVSNQSITKVPDSRAGSFRDQYSVGEASFSMVGPVSGLITYSGPIAFSGSLSLRSDSSTTSTRSFAFPVLQSEWHSSPVRMAKADRRHFRKQRGWRQGLLCCRF
ncbi:hypothetical protein CDL15_Pgr024187 [Punica granatum]|uniref:Uncharacterized protein n=1 Tax=Punica granatum TaxID=22663 RepID=A0A218XXY7_PUNGR|nr:hypothetical protein CDL15_Pgr024187 [Punica granatum]